MKRSSIGLRVLGLTWLFGAVGSVASAQDYQSYNYFPTPDIRTEQIFEPVDVSNYGSGPPRNEGWFADYRATYMSMNSPDAALLGGAGSSINTSYFETDFAAGNRLELGFIEENVGLTVSASYLGTLNQTIWGGGGQSLDPQVNVNDGVGIGIQQGGTYMTFTAIDSAGFVFAVDAVFREMTVYNKTQAYSGELMRTWRLPSRHPAQPYDPMFEFMAGVRYFRVNSNFRADGIYQGTIIDPDTLALAPIDESVRWAASVQNHMVLPQIGSNFRVKRGPWEGGISGRGFMGICVQDIRQNAQLGPNFIFETFDVAMIQSPTNSTNSAWRTAFALGGELRLDGKYNVTRRFAVDAGLTTIFINNCIGRANQATDYTIRQTGPAFGLQKNDMTYQDFFSAGVNLGISFNR